MQSKEVRLIDPARQLGARFVPFVASWFNPPSEVSMRRFATAFIALALVATTSARAQDKPVSYHKDIKPLFTAACNGCHRPEKSKGDLDMTTFAALATVGNNAN